MEWGWLDSHLCAWIWIDMAGWKPPFERCDVFKEEGYAEERSCEDLSTENELAVVTCDIGIWISSSFWNYNPVQGSWKKRMLISRRLLTTFRICSLRRRKKGIRDFYSRHSLCVSVTNESEIPQARPAKAHTPNYRRVFEHAAVQGPYFIHELEHEEQ